ncbi:DNA-binding transcriptional regulator YhcF (GntR family) [Microbacterium endophyticum]|uniref:DNA-binding transcriptional regulator YhcF (GntR family) n=1 Tax=Microbacterium endophyticum TaxID=1526412 RepID=A0A7W4V3N1_9MICO|nr:GntR family transcriptional regulator [Microbacterium endophyticum]MBB2976245.1 DNA-binding transcriptional regulator YhcF (GntR family) [Microbacterium endophyticum]NIK35125.1 DNA-binding transcriptional regulator YhcF (GntR family) [Microbacterium endophyticum]
MTARSILSADEDGSTARDIYHQLRGLIMSGQLGANERLPTVRQTATDLGVAQGTAAKAYKMLEHAGLVVSRTAAGTRVAESAAVLPRSIAQRIRELADEASATRIELDDVINVLRLVWRTNSGPNRDDTRESEQLEQNPVRE